MQENTNLNLRKKREKGITLIVLVITIIVLLILAGISISMLTGENGILTKARTAKEETRGATVEEARRIWKATKIADKLTGEKTVKTLKELVNELVQQEQLTEKEKDIIIGNKEKGIEAQYEITIGNRTINFSDMIKFSIDENEYEVEEGTTWKEFFHEKFPNDWAGWLYISDSGQVVYYYSETDAEVMTNPLCDGAGSFINMNNLIVARFV